MGNIRLVNNTAYDSSPPVIKDAPHNEDLLRHQTLANMINAVLVFNNAGQPRLTKFYTQLETSVQQRLISEIFALVSHRPSGSCNFLPLPPLLASSGTSHTPSHSSTPHNDAPSLSHPSSPAPAPLTPPPTPAHLTTTFPP